MEARNQQFTRAQFEELRTRQLGRLAALKTQQFGYRGLWRDLADFVDPTLHRFLVTDRNRTNQNLRNSKILNSTATQARDTLAYGLMSGITNPAQPWFQFKASDPSLNTQRSVKVYLDLIRERIADVFLRSNLYTQLPQTYANLGTFATDSFELVRDDKTTVRCYSHPIGSYFLDIDGRMAVDTNYRQFQMTVAAVVERYGLSNVCESTKRAYEQGNYSNWITITKAIEPNRHFDATKLDASRKKWLSTTWEEGSAPTEYLRVSGFDSFPVMAPRWQAVGEDVYGSNCPAMRALGDILQLQAETKRKGELVELHNKPPLAAPTSLKGKPMSSLPGGLTFLDVTQLGQGIAPIYQPSLPGMQYLLEDIAAISMRIDKAFYKDLFLMFADMTGTNRTATEIAARQEEKLLALGPVYMRQNDELLDPLVNRTFQIMVDQSLPYWGGMLNGDPMLPPPPPELVNADLTIEYISPMAQAMRSVGITSIERAVTFAGSMAQAFPEVLDNIAADKVYTRYYDMVGAPADGLVDEEQRDQIRAQKQQQMAAQQAMQAGVAGASAAKDLSQASLSDDNALSQLMGRLQGQPAPAPYPQGA